jgi:hypothetical protein
MCCVRILHNRVAGRVVQHKVEGEVFTLRKLAYFGHKRGDLICSLWIHCLWRVNKVAGKISSKQVSDERKNAQ